MPSICVANFRAAANVSGAPRVGSPSISPMGSNGPSVSLAGLPLGRRNRNAHDFAPDGWMSNFKPRQPTSATSIRFAPGSSLATDAAVRIFRSRVTLGDTNKAVMECDGKKLTMPHTRVNVFEIKWFF